MMRVPSEEDEQTAVFEWAAVLTAQWPELGLLHHIPNGGKRHPATAAKLKAQGVKPGVPDICLPVARQGYHGLYVEMKRRKGGQLSDHQKAWIEALRVQGYMVAVCKGADEAIEVLSWYVRG